MATGNGNASPSGDSPEDFRAWFRDFFNEEIRPHLQRHQEEVIEARFADLRQWIQTNSPSADINVIAAQVGQILGPKLTSEVQPLVDTVHKLAEKVGAGPEAGASGAAPTHGNAPTLERAVGLFGDLLDTAAMKILPMIQQWQMMKRGAVYDVKWAAQLRQEDPTTAFILGSVLNPDPLANRMPELLAQNSMAVGSGAYLRGLQTRIDAQKMLAGSGLWPAAPSSTLPSPSANPSGGPSTMPAGSLSPSGARKAGVSMQQKGRGSPRNSRQTGSNASSAAASEPQVKRLADFLK